MKGLTREWRCWREDGSYYGPCPPIEEPWEHEVWREDRHGDCGWQLYVMEADLNGVPMRLIPDDALVREWRCERADGTYGGPCQPEGWGNWSAYAYRHEECGWQLYALEAAFDGETP